jgi:predicted dehydrogenase
MALVGGGGSGFIGRVHAVAATLDHRAELAAGALSSDPERARAAAPAFGIAPQRAYGSYAELVESESKLPQDQRVDFVSIATPNNTHFPIARLALEAGFYVVCDKPMTTDLRHAEQLARLVEQSKAVFALTHNYAGYPLVRQAREMILGGELGEIQAIRVSYIQGGLRGLAPGETPARGAWKADPEKAGPAGTLADIGTHAYHLARYMTGLAPEEVACTLMTCCPGRRLDDYGHALIRFANGALGAMTISQAAHGRLNDLSIEIDGAKRSLSWRQEEPNQLAVRCFGQPMQVYERNPRGSYLAPSVRPACRLPGGHPEGFLEAFANLYCDTYEDMIARSCGKALDLRKTKYPNVYDGVEGVYFVEQCLASNREHGAWRPLRRSAMGDVGCGM